MSYFNMFNFGCFKIFYQKIKIKKLDLFMMKYHRRLVKILIALGCVHGLMSFAEWAEYSPDVYISGIICLVAIVLASKAEKLHKPPQWLFHHRLWSLLAVIILIIHLLLYVHVHV